MRSPALTDRQLDVLELALCGLTNKEIGDRLYLSLDTVKTHFRRMYMQLRDDQGRSATGAMHAVSLALLEGWLDYDPVTRRIVRPAGRRPLPAYAAPAGHDREPQRVDAEVSVQQRRDALGW